jgi:hypothetical protein
VLKDKVLLLLGNGSVRVLTLGISLRLIIFIITCIVPIPYGQGAPISPRHYQTGGDLEFYLNFISVLSGQAEALERFFGVYQSLFLFEAVQDRFPGPLYPLLLFVFDYQVGNTVLFSTVIFFTELATYVIWQKWLIEELGVRYALPFCFLLQPLWFSIYLSSDVFFYLICSLLYLMLYRNRNWHNRYLFWSLICLAVGLRPGGVAIVAFALVFFLSEKRDCFENKDKIKLVTLVSLLLISIIYYLPYGLIDRTIVNSINEFDVLSHQIVRWFNLEPLDFDSVMGSVFRSGVKFFWLFGFHPSESNLIIAVAYRLITGVFFLYGFIAIVCKKDMSAVYAILFVMPTTLFLYPGWRYLLPILPLLYKEATLKIKAHTDK